MALNWFKSSQSQKPIFLHACATCYELPSHISTVHLHWIILKIDLRNMHYCLLLIFNNFTQKSYLLVIRMPYLAPIEKKYVLGTSKIKKLGE